LPLLGRTTPRDVVYHPVGDTDSEAVFCAILNALSAEFADGLPTLPVLHEFLAYLCDEILEGCANDTIFNFLLTCGQYTMFAYSWPGKRPGSSVWNGLHYIVREPPFAHAKLLDVDYSIDFSTVTTSTDRVAVITTKPLTEEEGWTEFRPGELLMFDKGKPYRTPKCCEQVEKEGRGLVSKCVKQKHCTASPIWRARRPPQTSPVPTLPGASMSCTRTDDISPPVFNLASSEEVETVLTSPKLPRPVYSLPCTKSDLHHSHLEQQPQLALTASFREERQEKDSSCVPSSPSQHPKVAGALEGCLLSELSATNRTAGLYTKVL
jgi:Glutamine amidotransferases class-II